MLEHSGLRAILPQRHPILLLDRVTRLEPGRSVTAIKMISGCEPCYRDVSADAPPESYAFPVSLLVESFGQACAVLWRTGLTALERDRPSVLMFAAARNCRFFESAFPGDVLRHEARLENVIGDNAFATGEIWVGPRLVASMGSLIAVSRPLRSLSVSAATAKGKMP